jgi:hypothetical protein
MLPLAANSAASASSASLCHGENDDSAAKRLLHTSFLPEHLTFSADQQTGGAAPFRLV